MFIKHSNNGIVALLLYVDDIVITGSDTAGIETMIKELSGVFDVKDLGPLTYFLGISIQYTKSGILLSQAKYAHCKSRNGNMFWL